MDTSAPSERTLRAAAIMGLGARFNDIGLKPRAGADRLAERLLSLLAGEGSAEAPRIIHITGPSGAGKSLTLDRVTRELGDRAVVCAVPVAAPHTRVIDLFASPVEHALRLLAAAGMGEAWASARRFAELSAGERARVALGVSMEQVGRLRQHRTGRLALIVDELGSALDGPTGISVAASLRRWALREGAIDIIAAGVRRDVGPAIGADWVATMDLGGVFRLQPGRALAIPADPGEITISPGSACDFRALAMFHYRAGPPRGVVRVLTARARSGRTVGVLTVSMPVLNATWREQAWPGWLAPLDRRARAVAINDSLRVISRVIVHPAYRGRGIARRLVRTYLDHPLTPRTESLAAMGCACPFFRAAGMRELDPGESRRDRSLRHTLAAVGIEPWRLSDAGAIDAGQLDHPSVERALRAWARDSRATSRHAAADPRSLLRLAGESLERGMRVYVSG
ncbi:MAG: GNAT family N-acetyltransferase [Phycisphaeraceae bacterium]|nr:GNAT family N-acetyltransferase [Phycisphaeraceae bacterium]